MVKERQGEYCTCMSRPVPSSRTSAFPVIVYILQSLDTPFKSNIPVLNPYYIVACLYVGGLHVCSLSATLPFLWPLKPVASPAASPKKSP